MKYAIIKFYGIEPKICQIVKTFNDNGIFIYNIKGLNSFFPNRAGNIEEIEKIEYIDEVQYLLS